MSTEKSSKKHPEQQEDEYFLGNADIDSFSRIGWGTKRTGTTAYDTSGVPLGDRWRGSFPVFIKKSEVEKSNPELIEGFEKDNFGVIFT